MPAWLENLLPIAILLVLITLVVSRLPKVDLGHSKEFLRRRAMNWLPLGLTYALLYFGRYNLLIAKIALGDVLTKADFGHIKMIGSWVYGVSFLLNGPLTDMLGGRRTILLAAMGAAITNIAMGGILATGHTNHLVASFSLLYAVNMYFQSFGAVSIVKVNAQWFHIRERGMIGGVFGILIALGLYFAFDWSTLIVKSLPVAFAFFVPAAALLLFFVIDYFMVRDNPSDAGFANIETGDAKWDVVDAKKDSTSVGGAIRDALIRTTTVGAQMMKHPIVISIALIEFCSGFLRAGLMDGYKLYAEQTHEIGLINGHWGLSQCIAGILGGIIAGTLSDRLFGSRRGPVAAILYGVIVIGSGVTTFMLGSGHVGPIAGMMMLAIIGVHGMLSGTASMDFGGKENAGVAVGIIDGFVYLGVGLQAFSIAEIFPSEGAASANAANWIRWPISMVVIAIIGFALSLRLWNAKPNSSANAH